MSALMVAGTASGAGKSSVVTGLCRALRRRGLRVAPFKPQNMSLNSCVTPSGHEIGRSQATQAFAAGVEPEVAMNPVLLKPAGPAGCQVVVLGRPAGHLAPGEYERLAPELFDLALECLADLRRRHDVVLVEGAGGAAEVNLLDHDIANLRVAAAAGIPAVLVGDIERGGVFASLYGTLALLPPEQRDTVRGLVVNKLRGDPALLYDGAARLAAITGVAVLGVLPHAGDLGLDAEDGVFEHRPAGPTSLDVAAIRFPRLANPTDLDPLAVEPGVGVRWVGSAAALGRPDLVVLPGTKSTVTDLAWLRETGLDAAVARSGAAVLGICGGYQMLGVSISDPHGVEAPAGTRVDGLGMLGVETVFEEDKTLRHVPGLGYEIHHGRTTLLPGTTAWRGGAVAGAVSGTPLHGLFEPDDFRRDFLRGLGFAPGETCFEAARSAQVELLADLVERHLDMDAVLRLLERA